MSQNAPQTSAQLEREEPSASQSTVPIWLILLLGLLLYWGMNYVDDHGGWFSAQVYEPFTSYEEVKSSQPYDPEGEYLAIGAKVFNGTCVLCHQADGKGKPDQFPPLAGSDWVNAAGPNRIARIVLNGLGGSITVEGATGTVRMNNSMVRPGDFTDEQIGAVLTYVRQQWGNKASKVTPDQVKAVREAIKSHPQPFKPEELLEVPVQ